MTRVDGHVPTSPPLPFSHRWQKPRIILALYCMSAAISSLRMRNMVSKKCINSVLVVVTAVPGGSMRCAL